VSSRALSRPSNRAGRHRADVWPGSTFDAGVVYAYDCRAGVSSTWIQLRPLDRELLTGDRGHQSGGTRLRRRRFSGGCVRAGRRVGDYDPTTGTFLSVGAPLTPSAETGMAEMSTDRVSMHAEPFNEFGQRCLRLECRHQLGDLLRGQSHPPVSRSPPVRSVSRSWLG